MHIILTFFYSPLTNPRVTLASYQALNAAFPQDRRDFASFPHNGCALDGKTFSEVQATPYGQSFNEWMRKLDLDRFLNNAPHTLKSWLMLLGVITERTNKNIADGRYVVQLPAGGLSGIIHERSLTARDKSQRAFLEGPGGNFINRISGSETPDELKRTMNGYIKEAAALFDSAMHGLGQFSGCIAIRDELVKRLEEQMERAEKLRADKEKILEQQKRIEAARLELQAVEEKRLAAVEAQKKAEEQQKCEAEARRKAEQAAEAIRNGTLCSDGQGHDFSVPFDEYDYTHHGDWSGHGGLFWKGHLCCGKCSGQFRCDGQCGNRCGNPGVTTKLRCRKCGKLA